MIKGIDLIIRDLATTKLKFTHNVLHRRRVGVCYYCGEGVLMKKSKIPKSAFTGLQTITDLTHGNIKLLEKRYGIDFETDYEEGIKCNICKIGHPNLYPNLYNVEDVITHMNDDHSKSHKQLADNIKSLSKIYDLKTGKSYQINNIVNNIVNNDVVNNDDSK